MQGVTLSIPTTDRVSILFLCVQLIIVQVLGYHFFPTGNCQGWFLVAAAVVLADGVNLKTGEGYGLSWKVSGRLGKTRGKPLPHEVLQSCGHCH